MNELSELLGSASPKEYYTDKECRKKTVERFYYLYQPYVYLSDLPTEMGLKEGKYKFTMNGEAPAFRRERKYI